MATIADLEKEIESIKQRNERVEIDKAWETSWARKIVIAVVTYITISLFLLITNFQNPFIGAITPTVGFVLSTMSISFFKNLWLIYANKK